ncbi:MAG: class I SAM-dependent methyltransferase [Archaeoglobaceae archaeon]
MGNDKDDKYSTEIFKVFNSYDLWIDFKSQNNYILQESYRELILRKIKSFGILDVLTNERIPPNEIKIDSTNYRETLSARNLISRTRAVLLVLKKIYKDNIEKLKNLKIYSPEALTPFALYMRGHFPFYLGSEYGKSPEELFPIPMEDIQNLSFKNDSFDCVIVNDIFEHIPFLEKALNEIRRVLKPNGFLISTFPFAYNNKKTITKAYINPEGRIVYLTSPEYHPDPINDQGALVFQIPGWDILEKVVSAGFTRAELIFIVSADYGILAPEISGIFVLLAYK